jgi:tRNA-binding EMAP/Myf-like protein
LRGLISQGMIVAASLENGPPVLVAPIGDVPAGARLK